ncbi:hypothetical protein O3G_MSEX000573 [Manduca sexta]|nr:hypothetical protein O3G_MSEX000573 [Manduca sexta]
MLDHLNEEQKAFYGKKITTLNNYLKQAHSARFDSMRDENILETFMEVLLKDNPRELYKVESWRYMFYYNLMKLPLPEWGLAWVIKKFLSFPDV